MENVFIGFSDLHYEVEQLIDSGEYFVSRLRMTETQKRPFRIILGRKLAQGFIPHWVSNPDQEGADKINNSIKIVFSKTLDTSEWSNTVLTKGDLFEEITKLKKQDGKDMISYGGAAFVSELIKQRLFDELHLFIKQTAIGNVIKILEEAEYK